MKKLAFVTFLLISLNTFSQTKSTKTTLKYIVEQMTSQTESLKNIKEFKVFVNDSLVENIETYKLDPKSILDLGFIRPGAVDSNEKKTIIIVRTK